MSSSSSQVVSQYQAYETSGRFSSFPAASGLSSAGAICTTQIRDAREREKREIGVLNDRLADYIDQVRFLSAQNCVLEHDIQTLRSGFSGSSQLSTVFDSEISSSKRIVETIIANRSRFTNDIGPLESEIQVWRKKWLEISKTVKAHRIAERDVNLDKLAEIEAQNALFHRKIRIADEAIGKVRRDNGLIQGSIGRIHSQIHAEVAAKNERHASVQSLLQRVKYSETENSSKIQQEITFIHRDTTSENRSYFRSELQAAMRDIRANYEAISARSRQEIEIWYQKKIDEIRRPSVNVKTVNVYKDELVSIRSTLSSVQIRLAELESRNTLLISTISDLRRQQTEDARLFEASLAEKDAQIAKLRERCTEISIQMEKLCDREIDLQSELERYRTLLNAANITTYVSASSGGYRSSSTTTRNVTTNYLVDGSASSEHAITVGGNIGGISVGGHISGGRISGGAASQSGYRQTSYTYSASSNH